MAAKPVLPQRSGAMDWPDRKRLRIFAAVFSGHALASILRMTARPSVSIY
jgi:hypothetical protein